MQRRRPLSAAERNELWQRWTQGQALDQIGRALAITADAVSACVRTRNGVAPCSRHRSPTALSLEEREEISRGLTAHWTLRRIAAALGRAPSTISREILRNGGPKAYRAAAADLAAWRRARRPQRRKLVTHHHLRRLVASRLARDWSPEQIAHWLRLRFGDDNGMRVSHETIYQTLFLQARGALKKELMAHLRSGQRTRRRKKATTQAHLRGQIVDAVSIRERPAEVEDRAVPGHWEGDLLAVGGNGWIATLVERQSRFTMLVKLKGKDTRSVVKALARKMRRLPAELRQSLTWDRGTELARHKDFSIATDVKVYFCDPYSPWQRGTNENTNGLLRQYFPKGKDLSGVTPRRLEAIAKLLNERPRKTLGFQTPAVTLASLLQ